jgi:hypothetical protein
LARVPGPTYVARISDRRKPRNRACSTAIIRIYACVRVPVQRWPLTPDLEPVALRPYSGGATRRSVGRRGRTTLGTTAKEDGMNRTDTT